MSELLVDQEAERPPLVEKDEFGLDKLTEAGKHRVAEYVTDVEGDVYALTNMSEEMAAAAIARLSRSPEGVRVVLAREFIDQEENVRAVANRIVNDFGDDSVKQVGGGMKMVVENASNLLTKYLEWGRLAGYIEQSTRYIFFDRRDSDGRYRYHTPATLDQPTKFEFEKFADSTFDDYSTAVRGITQHLRDTMERPDGLTDDGWKTLTRTQACDAARLLLPVATKAIVGITGSAHAYENMIINLMSSDNAEARHAGENILREGRKIIPVLLAKTDSPDRGGAISAYKAQTRQTMRQLSPRQELEPQTLPSEAKLLDYSPSHELSLLPDMMYRFSNMNIEQLERELAEWSEDDILNAFTAYMGERNNRRHRPDRAIEVAQYVWDIVCDYGIFRDLQRHRMVDGLEWQDLHPYFGYELPPRLVESGYSDLANEVFENSLKQYELLSARGYGDEAQYATLLGHKMRWKMAFNAREAFHLLELRTQPAGHAGYRKLCLEMYRAIEKVHPNLAKAMIFINTEGGSVEQTRLGEIRANERRRQLLGGVAIDYDSSDI